MSSGPTSTRRSRSGDIDSIRERSRSWLPSIPTERSLDARPLFPFMCAFESCGSLEMRLDHQSSEQSAVPDPWSSAISKGTAHEIPQTLDSWLVVTRGGSPVSEGTAGSRGGIRLARDTPSAGDAVSKTVSLPTLAERFYALTSTAAAVDVVGYRSATPKYSREKESVEPISWLLLQSHLQLCR